MSSSPPLPATLGSARPRRVRPYPLDELPRLLRAQVELGRVLWRHLHALVDSAAIGSPAGLAAVETLLGGRLTMSAQAPYLADGDRLPALLRGARLFELSLLTPGQPKAILAIDEQLALLPRLRSDERLLGLLHRALHGAPLRLTLLPAAEVAALSAEPGFRSLLAVDLALTVLGQSGWGRLVASATLRLGVSAPPSATAHRRALARQARLDGVQVELGIEAGYGFLPARELLSLRPGDVVLLDRFGPRPIVGGPVWLRLGGGVFAGHLDGAGVTVLGSFHLRAEAMPEMSSGPLSAEPPSDPASDGPTDGNPSTDAAPPTHESLLRELPIQVTCEIGRVTLSAREILDLRPGAVLPVGRPLAGPVDLTTGGRILARGELVDVEGEIGIRVTEVLD
jgi:type III secretion system YscQ/HrcQ family protein